MPVDELVKEDTEEDDGRELESVPFKSFLGLVTEILEGV
jgi:hypothetical protein